MDVLRRIDKGYGLVSKAKRKAASLLDIQEIHDLEEEIGKRREEERLIREIIDSAKEGLIEKERLLSDIEKEMNEVLKCLYESHGLDKNEEERMKRRQLFLAKEKEKTESALFTAFSTIDIHTKKLYKHKHKVGMLEKNLSKQKICQHEQMAYLEDRIKGMEKKIRKLRKTVDEEWLNLYDSKRQELGCVFAKVEKGHCICCEAKVSEELQSRLEKKIPVLCVKCGHLLYTEADDGRDDRKENE